MAKNYIYSNVKFLAKIKGISMENIEEPHPAGYLSRKERLNNCWSLPLSFVYDLSKYLDVPIEDLIEKDLESVDELEKVRGEIEKLREREKELINICEVT